MKYSHIISLALGLCFLWSCNRGGGSIDVRLDGLNSDTIYAIRLATNSNTYATAVFDTIVTNHGKFTYQFDITEPNIVMFGSSEMLADNTNMYIMPSARKAISLLIKPNDKFQLTGKSEPYFTDYTVKGSDFNEAATDIRNKMKNNYIDIYQLCMELKKHATNDSMITVIGEKIKPKMQEISTAELDYVKANPGKDLSAYYLISKPLDTFGVYYENLSDSIKNGTFSKALSANEARYKKYIAALESEKEIAFGKKAPDFTLKTLDGNNFTLSSIKGKYIVLDFWGSWCSYCIKSFPRTKEYYNKYKSKLEIVGIACRDKENDWRNAVEKYELNWRHVINSADNDLSVKYAIKGYPTMMILGKDLTILGIYLGESDDFYRKLDELMRK